MLTVWLFVAILLVVGCWLVIVGCWLLIRCGWSLTIGLWWLDAEC